LYTKIAGAACGSLEGNHGPRTGKGIQLFGSSFQFIDDFFSRPVFFSKGNRILFVDEGETTSRGYRRRQGP